MTRFLFHKYFVFIEHSLTCRSNVLRLMLKCDTHMADNRCTVMFKTLFKYKQIATLTLYRGERAVLDRTALTYNSRVCVTLCGILYVWQKLCTGDDKFSDLGSAHSNKECFFTFLKSCSKQDAKYMQST